MADPFQLGISTILKTRDGTSATKDARYTNMLIEARPDRYLFLKRAGYQYFDGSAWPVGPALGTYTRTDGTTFTTGGAMGATSLPDGTVLTIVTGTATGTATGTGTGPYAVIHVSSVPKTVQTTPPINWKIITAMSPSPVITVTDQNGNTLTGYTGTVTASLYSNPAGGTLSGTLSVAAVSGVATFSNLSIDKVGTGYQLQFGAPAMRGVISPAFEIVSYLKFTTQPAGTTKNTVFSCVVSAVDSSGSTITGYTGNVTIAISNNPGSPPGVLSGTLTQTAVSGVATFNDLQISENGTGYTLIASEA